MAPLPGALTGGMVGIGVCLVASMVGIFIQQQCSVTTPCMCIASNSLESDDSTRCKLIPLYMKVPLIAVHLIPFILFPISIWVFQANGSKLVKMGAKSPVQIVWGLAYIMVSISGEVGWHVHQKWFYHEDYDILNFFFYAFNTLGATFWALGVQTEATQSSFLDGLLMLCMPLATLAYGYAAYATANKMPLATKVPIYLIMTYQYFLLAWRLFKLLKDDFKVWLFPFFSVGANLFFVFLLSIFQADVILNPLFHILHDAAGTEMGILIITIVVWSATANTYQGKQK